MVKLPDWMVIDSVRYALGRTSYQVGVTARWLVTYWNSLPESAREIIQRDIEEAFDRDDRDRETWREALDPNRPKGFELGWDCDRQSWEAVRALWKPSEPREDPAPEPPSDPRDHWQF